MKVHFRTIGCRLNQSEIDTMARQLEQQGHQIVTDPREADQFIVNTCAVTKEAGKTSRQIVRELNRHNAQAEITVTGCYSQIAPDSIAVLPGVSQIVDNQAKDQLVETITGTPTESFNLEPLERDTIAGAQGRTRAFIKVQDGCENECTFCVTTIARGEGRSRSMDDIIQEIQYLHGIGFQEAILTGVHLGSYGYDFGNRDGLKGLVIRILNETEIPRLRLSSLEPWDISEGFFDLWENPRLCPHLHLPLQSGCDATLRRMRRNTNQTEFRQLVQTARKKIPDVRITSDVIVGFPGETEAEFATSEAFIREMNFADLHIFRYSVREGTPAARMKQQVPNRLKKQRSAILHTMAEKNEKAFSEQYLGTTRPVLWEQISGATENGFINVGYTDNYIRVRCIHPRVFTNEITLAELKQIDKDSLVTAQPVLK